MIYDAVQRNINEWFYCPSMNDKITEVTFKVLREVDSWISGDLGIQTHHYVKDWKAVELIVEHKQLRMTRFDRMRNDPKEIRFASMLFSECIDDLLEKGSVDEYEAVELKKNTDFSSDVLILVPDHNIRMLNSKRVNMIPYVACFCP